MTKPSIVDHAMINKLVGIVLANLNNEKFGVGKLAEEAGMSRVTVHRKIKSIKGQSVSQFIREIRLQKAIEMLQNGEGNVAEIAFRVGFGSPSYFIKCFHEYFDFPPGEARKMKSNEAGDFQIIEKTLRNDDHIQHSFKPDIKSLLKKTKQKNILIAALSILSIILIICFLFTPLGSYENSIAVLPFRNDSSDTTNLYLINGFMERITTNLQMIKELRVISRSSVEKYRDNKTKSASEIARELGVNYLVEGSVRKSGNSMSITIHFIRTKGRETHIWGNIYNLQTNDVNDYIRLESEISQKIAGELKAVVSPEEKQLIERIPTTQLTAYDFYQRGREAYSKYWISNIKSELEKAEKYYNKALEYDSTFPQAYAGLAMIYRQKEYYKTFFSENFIDTVLTLSNKALSFDDKVEEAYISKGVYYLDKGQGDESAEEFSKALKINPNSWEAYFRMPTEDLVIGIENLLNAASLNRGTELPSILKQLAYLLGRLSGFPEQARNYLQEALELDGDSASYYRLLAGLERSQGNFNKEIYYLLKSFSTDSSNIYTIIQLGDVYGWIGQYKEALKYTKVYLDKLQNPLQKEIMHEAVRIGYAYWQNGYRTEGQYYFKKQLETCLDEIKLERRGGMDELLSYYDLAAIYAFLGEKDKAYDNLKKLNEKKYIYRGMLTWIKTDPLFNSIRNEPEFQHIIRDQEARYQSDYERVRKWLEEHGML